MNIELLLALIEMNQFKKFINDRLKGINGVTENIQIVDFPESIPTALTIETKWNDDEMKDIKTKAYHIYNKYVKEDSSLEINISYKQRGDLKRKLDDLSRFLQNKAVGLQELLIIFDDVMDELIQLLQFSMNRFKNQSEFEQVVHLPQTTV